MEIHGKFQPYGLYFGFWFFNWTPTIFVQVWILFIYHILFSHWVFFCIKAIYQYSAFIVIVQWYCIIKQRSLNRKFDEFYQKWKSQNLNDGQNVNHQHYQYYQFNNRYVNLIKEIKFMNDQVKRFLSILFMGIILLLTYLACLIFLVNLIPGYKYPYCCLFCNHLIILSIFIYNCSKIEQKNCSFLKLNRKCLDQFPMNPRQSHKVLKLINN